MNHRLAGEIMLYALLFAWCSWYGWATSYKRKWRQWAFVLAVMLWFLIGLSLVESK